MGQVLIAAMPEFRNHREVFDRVYADLQGAGLVGGSLKGMATGAGLLNKGTTAIGDAFLRFIRAPETNTG